VIGATTLTHNTSATGTYVIMVEKIKGGTGTYMWGARAIA